MDKLVPKRRFKEFKDADAWEKRRFSNICSMHARIGWQNLRTSEFLDEGDYYLVTGTDFDNGKINFETCHYVEKVRFEQDKNIQLKDGNILITKDGTLGKVAIVEGLDKPATLNAGVFNIEIKEDDANNIYVYQYLKAPFLMDYVARHATGGTIKHLNQNILINFPVWMSCLEEQMRVGHFLQQLDNIITLQQRKLDKLKNMKSALLYEMFPVGNEKKPRRRLAGFTDDWEQCKLGEVMNVTSVKRIHQSDWMASGIRFLRARDIVSFAKGEIPTDCLYISEEKYEEYSKISGKVEIGDLLVTGVGSIGVPYLIESKAPLYFKDGNIIWFKNKSFDGKFFYYSFTGKQIQSFIKNTSGSGTVGTYTIESGEKTPIIFPTLEEQKQIGTFFQQLDNTITLQQRKLKIGGYYEIKNFKRY